MKQWNSLPYLHNQVIKIFRTGHAISSWLCHVLLDPFIFTASVEFSLRIYWPLVKICLLVL